MTIQLSIVPEGERVYSGGDGWCEITSCQKKLAVESQGAGEYSACSVDTL